MTLNVTPGDPNANSYALQADADTFALARGFTSFWDACTVPQKEGFLQWATRLLDQLDWKGGRLTPQQALRWPRVAVLDQDGWLVQQSTIPKFLLNATCELAILLAVGDRTDDGGTLPISRVQVGTLSVDFNAKMPPEPRVIPKPVKDYVRPYLRSEGARLVRC
jgi:hypothetical protein